MINFIATIKDPVGLHARPASLVVQAANKFKGVELFIYYNEKSGNLKSIMSVMALGVMQGAQVKIEANGQEAEQALKTIKQVMIDHDLI